MLCQTWSPWIVTIPSGHQGPRVSNMSSPTWPTPPSSTMLPARPHTSLPGWSDEMLPQGLLSTTDSINEETYRMIILWYMTYILLHPKLDQWSEELQACFTHYAWRMEWLNSKNLWKFGFHFQVVWQHSSPWEEVGHNFHRMQVKLSQAIGKVFPLTQQVDLGCGNIHSSLRQLRNSDKSAFSHSLLWRSCVFIKTAIRCT